MGFGILYLILAKAIVLVFVILGAAYGPMPRWSSALFSGGVAALVILASIFVIHQAHESKNAQAFSAMQRDCAKNTGFCPLPDPLRPVPPQR